MKNGTFLSGWVFLLRNPMRLIAALLVGCLIPLATAWAEKPPDYVTAINRALGEARPEPATAPKAWLLAFVDVETTGLVPGYHEMVDIGVVLTDLSGAEVGSFFVRMMPDHPERASDITERINSFTEERWRSLDAVDEARAVEDLVAFHRKHAGDRAVLMVAYNSWFDIAFLDYLFRQQGRTWRELYHYFILDLPSMAWGQGLRHLAGKPLAESLGLTPETSVAEDHTGLSGARFNVAVYRALMSRLATADGEGEGDK
ncbi:MAG: exonuclease domain-containing protein [Opitutales bacterium]